MSRFFLWIKSQMLLLFLAHLRRLIYKLQLEVRVLSWWWPLTRGLTCGCGGERQTQHLRVMSLDLHQLFQKVQTKDTEHTHTETCQQVILSLWGPRFVPQHPSMSCLLLQVSTAVSGCQVLPIRTNSQHSDPSLPISPCWLPPLPLCLQVLRVLPHI